MSSNNNNNATPISNLQRIIQQHLNQDQNNIPFSSTNRPSATNSNNTNNEIEPFSMNRVMQIMNRYHTIMEEYQNIFRLFMLMSSLEQTLQNQQRQQQQQQQQQRQQQQQLPRPSTSHYRNQTRIPPRNPFYNPPNPIGPPNTLNQENTTTSQRHLQTEPGNETQQTVSFVDVVVELDENFDSELTQSLLGNHEDENNQHIQNFVSNMFQNENFRNNILQTTGITPSTNMQWFTSVVNSSNLSSEEREHQGLTNEQIENCTRRFTYRTGLTELLSHTCPITMEDFREGDVLLQLTECSHAFREMDLLRWFVTHSTCPVCRHSYHNFTLND